MRWRQRIVTRESNPLPHSCCRQWGCSQSGRAARDAALRRTRGLQFMVGGEVRPMAVVMAGGAGQFEMESAFGWGLRGEAVVGVGFGEKMKGGIKDGGSKPDQAQEAHGQTLA